MEEESPPLERAISLDALIIIFVKKKPGRLNVIRKGFLIIPQLLFFAIRLKCTPRMALLTSNSLLFCKTKRSGFRLELNSVGQSPWWQAFLGHLTGWLTDAKSTKKHAIESKHRSVCCNCLLIICLIAVIIPFSNQEKLCRTCLFPKWKRQDTFAKN